jgi:hypothetical protein
LKKSRLPASKFSGRKSRAADFTVSVHEKQWLSEFLDSEFMTVQGVELQPGSFGLKQAPVGPKSILLADR